jgi:hypothetical protein
MRGTACDQFGIGLELAIIVREEWEVLGGEVFPLNHGFTRIGATAITTDKPLGELQLRHHALSLPFPQSFCLIRAVQSGKHCSAEIRG